MINDSSREQASSTTLSVGSAGLDVVPVIALEGDEEIGRSPRLEITFAAGEIDAAAVVGAEARLVLGRGGQVRGGVIAAIEQGEALGDGRWLHRATLVPRAWLLSRGRTTRVFERLSAPEIIEAVVAGSGLDVRVDARLRDAYPARSCTVQHRESDLDFVLRIAERDGIAVRMEDDGERCVLGLTDHNDALPDAGTLADASGIRRRTALLPRRVDLVSADPARPELPLRASATVSEAGAGELTIYDLPFSTPEEGARAARLHAEWLRSTATRIQGVSRSPVSAGSRVVAGGRAILVVSTRHVLSPEGEWISKYSAIPAETPFRPERRSAAPRAFGLLGGRLSPREPGQDRLSDDEGRYRVREIAGDAERIMPMAGGGAFERDLTEGAQVVWGCLEGDPERPVITAVFPGSASMGRAVVRGPGGSVFELGGAASPGLGEVEGSLHGRDGAAVPAVAHHAVDDEQQFTFAAGTEHNDTWMRFAVPHTSGAWSYVRIGEAAVTAPPLTATNSNEKSVTFVEDKATCGALELNEYNDEGLAGSFEFTTKNRTVLTKGQWEHIVGGSGRVKIADSYELNATEGLSTLAVQSPMFTFTNGNNMSGVNGFSLEHVLGTKVETAIGARFDAGIGVVGNVTVGYKVDLILADSFEKRIGEELSDASTMDKRASKKIQLSISPGGGSPFGWDVGGGLAAVALATGLGYGVKPREWDPGILSAATSAGLLAGLLGLRLASRERELKDGNPIVSLDDVNSRAALRSDDWILLMSPEWAILGKNKKHADETQIAELKEDDAETALVIEENQVIRLQADKHGAGAAEIELDGKTILISGDKITIKAPAGKTTVTIDGALDITGNLTVSGNLEVTGKSTLKGAFDATAGTLVAKT